jgi:hypothetical protein
MILRAALLAAMAGYGCGTSQSGPAPGAPEQGRLTAVAVMENTGANVSSAMDCLAKAGIESISDASVLAWIVVAPENAERAAQVLLAARAARPDGSAWFSTPGEYQARIEHHKRSVQEYHSARTLLENLEIPRAIECLDRAVALDPDWPEPYWFRAAAHLVQAEVAAALEDFDLVRDWPQATAVYVGYIREALEGIREDR